jgi:hypothetical protein
MGAKDANQMIGVLTGERGAVTRNFIGNPSASSHPEKKREAHDFQSRRKLQ